MLLTHGDSVLQLAPSLQSVGQSGPLVAALKHQELPVYGLQFHPEADLTINGLKIFTNFLYNVCCVAVCVCVLGWLLLAGSRLYWV